MYKNEFDQIYNGNSSAIIALFDKYCNNALNAMAKTDNPFKGDRLVHAAARMGDVNLLQKCVEAGLDLNPHKSAGHYSVDSSPLYLAAQELKVECLQILLRYLTPEQIHSDFNSRVLERVVQSYSDNESAREKVRMCIEALLAVKVAINKRFHSPLMSAVNSSNIWLTELLLRHGADPLYINGWDIHFPIRNSPDPNSHWSLYLNTALKFAILSEKTHIVRAILDVTQIDVNLMIRDNDQIEYPLIFLPVITTANVQMVTLLRQRGANLNRDVTLDGVKLSMLDAYLIHRSNMGDTAKSMQPIIQQFLEAGCKSELLNQIENDADSPSLTEENPVKRIARRPGF